MNSFWAALKPWEKEEIDLVKKAQKAGKFANEPDRVRVKRVYRNGNLVLSHGRSAVIASRQIVAG